MASWIKIFRELLQWEWFQKPEMVQLFIYLLLKANCEDKQWQGMVIKRGQLVTSNSFIRNDLKLSEQTVRTCMKRLISTGEITYKSTNRFVVITICNYDKYQEYKTVANEQINEQINEQSTSNQRTNQRTKIGETNEQINEQIANVNCLKSTASSGVNIRINEQINEQSTSNQRTNQRTKIGETNEQINEQIANVNCLKSTASSGVNIRINEQINEQSTSETTSKSTTTKDINIDNHRLSSKEYNSLASIGELPEKTEEKPKTDRLPAKEIKEMWNTTCTSFPKLFTISENRKNKMRLRISEMGGIDKALPLLKQIFEKMQESNFLKGDNKRGWKASFDWLFENDKNWVKVFEGNYDNKPNQQTQAKYNNSKKCNDEWT